MFRAGAHAGDEPVPPHEPPPAYCTVVDRHLSGGGRSLGDDVGGSRAALLWAPVTELPADAPPPGALLAAAARCRRDAAPLSAQTADGDRRTPTATAAVARSLRCVLIAT
eukprot:CAMPEP_0178731262 /NCGR_PEP_ID=MMETSP0699-20121125/29947_1 /TAXON_ID=265572 /ORGANISM="Extubocellulus spinifer, Strain CCMP396" /LENGTH=109 /DNA_ID=CAMNT_0020383319 /DNA_START=40 /DNA_END=370 /DNA_ORIENTATION=+